ncbi:Crp/Fnr family transcriptional regulator [Pedobacter insulae]|uniref:cAMP-binding domain of CRP or a regulatory subunit of cAMP-dependent protein kinases n=1 Tax=Pedobacter insulae TaxID=414048 RepID=A0A1I2VLM4_9SPHI|nr:Crp/Fnr family transcriptional regulator [Pedobacter insulae]SFG88396.1 cAMP-binding domain of CRP or a regulatory subunit of cAMP-dependent protein kinases [Pedobacter insulae]
MRTNSIHQYLCCTLSVNEPALSLILSQKAKRVNYDKNEIIDQKGKIPLQLSFIEKGNAIALSHSKPNRQVMRFWKANQLICPTGFFNNQPSPQSIIALDNCEIMVLSYLDILTFLAEFPTGYTIINSILKAEINLVEMNIRSFEQNKMPRQHEAFLEALAISFNE